MRLKLRPRSFRGLQNISLDHITGSAGRYHDFNCAFLPPRTDELWYPRWNEPLPEVWMVKMVGWHAEVEAFPGCALTIQVGLALTRGVNGRRLTLALRRLRLGQGTKDLHGS